MAKAGKKKAVKKKAGATVNADKSLRVLIDRFGVPKYVVEKDKKRSGMTAVLSNGETVQWTTKSDFGYLIQFVDGSGAPCASPFVDWNYASSRPSVEGAVSGQVGADVDGIVFKYNVVGDNGLGLDPEIIIEK